MSTDSTELTFVRCPSCRSLVPAISTRCRMCGATLEASAVADGGDQEQKKSGRVRQRTMSESSSDLASTAAQVREEPPVEAPKPAPVFVAPVEAKVEAPADDVEDPLSAYIEEVELKDENGSAPTKALEEEPVEEDDEVAPIAPPVREAAPVEAGPSFDDDDDDSEVDLLGTEEEVEEEPKSVAPPAPQARVIVESGSRKPGRSSQLAFGGAPKEPPPVQQAKPEVERPKAQPPQGFSAPRPEVQEPQQPRNKPEPKVQHPQQQARPPQQNNQQQQSNQQRQENQQRQAQQNQQRQQQQNQQRQQQQQQQQQTRSENPRPEPQQNRPRQQEPREQPHQAPPAREQQSSRAPAAPFQPGASKSESVSGRLFGWLVNYNDPSGAAAEIREGKFFVSAKSVKPSDLVIDDKTISSPHALLMVSPGTGFVVQDLMSERGVFVRKKGSDTYKKEEEPVSLTHGDWVRFGDVEFLISLIAHPGEV